MIHNCFFDVDFGIMGVGVGVNVGGGGDVIGCGRLVVRTLLLPARKTNTQTNNNK